MRVTRRNFIAKAGHTCGYGAAFSAIQALGLLAQPEEQSLESIPKDLGKGKTVVILGAGIAGMVAAYELRKAGFECTLLEARERPGGRNWTIRNGSTIEFTDGSVQRCDWNKGLYLNAGPARIPSIQMTILGYCEQLGIPLEMEINTSRSALMQSGDLNGGAPVEQRQVIYDSRGHLAELFSKAIHQDIWMRCSARKIVNVFLHSYEKYGDLNNDLGYMGSERSGYAAWLFCQHPSGERATGLQTNASTRRQHLFAGDYLSQLVGWQEGAALSARRVVAEIAKRV